MLRTDRKRFGTDGSDVAAAGSLGTAVRARLDELGLPARRFTAAGYISAATLSRVFAGQDSLRDPKRAAELERGLGWRAGSINAVRSGRSASAIDVVGWPRADGDWRAAVEAAWSIDGAGAAGPMTLSDMVLPEKVASLVDFLFTTVHPADAPELTLQEIEKRVGAGGGSLSTADLEALRVGERSALARPDAQALAGAFGVPTSYFFDPVDEQRVRDQLLAVVALREAGVEQLAYRLAGLTGDQRKTAESVIESLNAVEERKRAEGGNGTS